MRMRTTIHVFTPNFEEIGKAEMTNPVCGFDDEK